MSVILFVLVVMLVSGIYFFSKGNHAPEHKRLSRYGGEQGQAAVFVMILLGAIAAYVYIMLQHASIYTAF